MVLKKISSSENGNVKMVKSLADKKGREQFGMFVIEGEHLISDAISLGVKLESIFVDEQKYDYFKSMLENIDCDVFVLSSLVFKKIANSENSQGVLACVLIPKYEDFDFSGRFLVLDRISDPGNMGTIIRSAVATNFSHIVCLNCVDVFNPKTVRSTSSGIFSCSFSFLTEKNFLSNCKTKLLIASAEGENVFSTSFSAPKNFALVIGNEAHGVSENLKNAGKIISLPMSKNIESLNAGVSASVLMYVLQNVK